VADRDIFTKNLGRNWSPLARQLAAGVAGRLPLALRACHAINATLNSAGGIPEWLFAAVSGEIAAAREDRRTAPLFDTPLHQYGRRIKIRELCDLVPGLKLGKVVLEAASRVLVEERSQPLAAALPKERHALASSIQIEVFEECFAGPVIAPLQQEGLSATQARQEVDDCREAMVQREEYKRLTRSIARRPEAIRRRIGIPSKSKVATKELLHQPLVGTLVGASGS
jgi:hypothetical protein